jgi:hypothetical protein
VEGEVNEGTTDEDTQVLADITDVETEHVGQDEEEDTNGSELDQNGDDLQNDLLDFHDGLEDVRGTSVNQVTDHDGCDENGEQAVGCEGVDDIDGDQRLEHLHDNVGDVGRLALFECFLVIFRNVERFNTRLRHKGAPD